MMDAKRIVLTHLGMLARLSESSMKRPQMGFSCRYSLKSRRADASASRLPRRSGMFLANAREIFDIKMELTRAAGGHCADFAGQDRFCACLVYGEINSHELFMRGLT